MVYVDNKLEYDIKNALAVKFAAGSGRELSRLSSSSSSETLTAWEWMRGRFASW